MTTAQLSVIHFGLIGFVGIWPVVFVVQVAVRPAGLVRRALASGVVTLYACLAAAAVLLPLPTSGSRRLVQTIQLLPFQWVSDIGAELHKHELPIWAALQTQTFQQAVMNVLLFVPLGVLARVLWKRGLNGAALIGFAASLLIEVTQLTANFGTAPFVYRIFDVDDLITNTAGAALGWLVVGVITRVRVETAQIEASPKELAHLS